MTSSAAYGRLQIAFMHATAVVADFTVTKQSFLEISETAWASNFKIYHNIALDNVYISTEHDVIIIVIRLAANCMSVVISGHVWVFGSLFIYNGSNDVEKV